MAIAFVFESDRVGQADDFYGSEQFSGVTAASEAMGLQTTPWPLHRIEIDRTVKAIQ